MAKRLSRARGVSLIIYQGLPRYNHKNGMHAHVCGRGKGSRHARKLHMPTAGGTAPAQAWRGRGTCTSMCTRQSTHPRAPPHTRGSRGEGGAHKHAGCSQKREDKEPGAKHLTHSMRCGPNRSKEDHADKAKIKLQKTMHINRKGEAE